eukprot:scaffold15277_cov129-Isochrysis_galbana.AAC.5
MSYMFDMFRDMPYDMFGHVCEVLCSLRRSAVESTSQQSTANPIPSLYVYIPHRTPRSSLMHWTGGAF